MDQKTMPTTIHIDTKDNDRSLTNQSFSELKLDAIAELEEVTAKGKLTINTAVMTATTHAINNLRKDYKSILTNWDKTKTELDIDTQRAITSIQNAIDDSTENVS